MRNRRHYHRRASGEPRNSSTNDDGFTLVELSMVLVVVALLIAGIVVGRGMISAARVRNTANDIESYRAAFNLFKSKFGWYPGDIPNASSLGLGTHNGNGNWAIPNFDLEAPYLWEHLSNADLIKGDYTGNWYAANNTYSPGLNAPQTRYEAKTMYRIYQDVNEQVATTTSGFSGGSYMKTGHVIEIFSLSATDVPAGNGYVVPATEAKLIDSKFDDGLPVSGKIIWETSGVNICATQWTNVWRADTGSGQCTMRWFFQD